MLGSPWGRCRAPRTRIRARPEQGRCWPPEAGTKGHQGGERGSVPARVWRWPSTESSSRPRATINCPPFLPPAGMASPPQPCRASGPGCRGLGLETSEARLATRASTGPIPRLSPSGWAGVDPGPPRPCAREQVDAAPGRTRLAAPAAVASTATHTAAALHVPLHIEEQPAASCPASDRHGFRAPRDSGVNRLRGHDCGEPGVQRGWNGARSQSGSGHQARGVRTGGKPPLPAKSEGLSGKEVLPCRPLPRSQRNDNFIR